MSTATIIESPVDQFRQAISAAGITAPDTIREDGVMQRFSTSGRANDDSGWCVLHLDGVPAGSFGDWRTGLSSTWCSKSDNDMTQPEREAMRKSMRAMQAQRDADKAIRQQQAAGTALALWQRADPEEEHPYRVNKGIQAHGTRVFGNSLLVPVRDVSATLQSLQTIEPDGSKRFHAGGRVTGCYHSIGKPDKVLIVCEGFATGASIHEATADAVAICFTAGNFTAVATALHRKYPDLTILCAADDDHLTAGNPGLTAAKAAALAVGGFAVIPQFPAGRPAKSTDFNDLAALAGLDAVSACFSEIKGIV